MEYDLIQLDTSKQLHKGSKLMERIQGNITSNVTFALYVSDVTDDMEDDSARALAEVLWVDGDKHSGLAKLDRLYPESLLKKTTREYLIRTLNDWDGASMDNMDRLQRWIRYCMLSLGRSRAVPSGSALTPDSQLQSFIKMCTDNGFHDIAVYVLTTVGNDWDALRQIVRTTRPVYEADTYFQLKEVDHEFSTRLLLFSWNKAPWSITIDILLFHFGNAIALYTYFCPELFHSEELYLLAKRCENHGLKQWGLFFYLHASKHWRFVQTYLEQYTNHEMLSFPLIAATKLSLWELVEHLLPRCLQFSSKILEKVFVRALTTGQVNVIELLLSRGDLQEYDLSNLQPFENNFYILSCAIDIYPRHTAEKLTRLAVRAGLASQCDRWIELLRQIIDVKRPKIAKMLFQAGMFPRQDCIQALGKLAKLPSIANDQDMAQTVAEILDFVHSKGVRSLQEICRIRVSQLLGYQHVRERKIEALEVNDAVRNLLTFQDV